MNCIRARDFEISGLGAAVPGYAAAPSPTYYAAPPASYYAAPVPQAPPTAYYQQGPPPPSGPVAENKGGKWKWDGGKAGEFDVYGRAYGSPVVPDAGTAGGGSGGPVAHVEGGKWKWEGGRAGQVDALGHSYGSPAVDDSSSAIPAMLKPAGISLEDMMLWAAAGAAGIGIAWVLAKRRKK